MMETQQAQAEYKALNIIFLLALPESAEGVFFFGYQFYSNYTLSKSDILCLFIFKAIPCYKLLFHCSDLWVKCL